MRFADPGVLWALAGAPVLLAALVASILARRRALKALAEPRLLDRIVTQVGIERRVLKASLCCGAAALLILSLARPQWGMTLDPVARRGVDVVLAVDVSASMLAEDVRPSRLERARSEAGRLAGMLHGDRIAVVAFAGSAARLCPLTLDHAAARLFIDALDPGILGEAGTSLGLAVRECTSAFSGREKRFKAAVIFSDGEDHEGSIEPAAAEAADQGVVIHTVGVGTAAGGPIPLRDEKGAVVGYKEDREGRVVTSRLQEEGLAAVAEATGALYMPSTAAGGEIEKIAEAIGAMDKREMQQRLLTRFEERFQVPLAAALILLIVEALIPDRRKIKARAGAARIAAGLLLAVTAAPTPAAFAASAASLVEEGNRHLSEGRYDEALRLYTQAQIDQPDTPEIHLDIGNVFYRKGEFEKAREAYRRAFEARERSLAESARYNAGTASLAGGRLEEAVDHYREALKMNPGDADARRNLELALRRMSEKPPPAKGSDTEKRQQQAEAPPAGGEGDRKEQPEPAPRPGAEKKQGGEEDSAREEPGPPQRSADRKERQEAERILDALKGEDKPQVDARRRRRPERPPARDW